ncbi:MAG: hypothetical protein Q9167_005231 [Letrouitia subvulpina]
MTRPQIIRADTIDLQDQESPSAKDHTRQPAHPAPLGDGPPAPHQERALKHAEQENAVELHHTRSPRVSQDLSGKELQLLHEDGDAHDLSASSLDPQNLQRHGDFGGSEVEGDIGDVEGDDSLEDDMMDKMSSSPSIDDEGWYGKNQGQNQEKFGNSFSSGIRDRLSPLLSEKEQSSIHEQLHMEDSLEAEFEPGDFHYLLVPADDPLLDNSFDDAALSQSPPGPSLLDSNFRWNDGSGQVINASGGGSHGDDDDNDVDDATAAEIFLSDDRRFIDSGWGGECLREIEDIDFEFVYALHTFVATVEGQANATKGETMVLLDDSNSYWWLVRVGKDGSIGYLPAEHIETPTERLARLNKHRNIDLSQTMLGDNPEKSKNPLKKAIRRRNGKTVQFAAPTYVEASDMDYSSEEEEDAGEEYLPAEEAKAEPQEQDQESADEDATVAEPLNSRGRGKDPSGENQTRVLSQTNGIDQDSNVEKARTSEELFDVLDESPSSKSRKGTVRNTDSFFRDDNTETRRINLTPSLLRDDSSGSTVRSVEGKEQLKNRPSLDSLEKAASPPEKGKDDRKRKEKKGMLGGIFKRKDKKARSPEQTTEDGEKISEEIARSSPQPTQSSESLPSDAKPSLQPQPQRQTSKLQKSPPIKLSPKTSLNRGENPSIKTSTVNSQNAGNVQWNRSPPQLNVSIGSTPLIRPESMETYNDPSIVPTRSSETEGDEASRQESHRENRRGMFSPIRDALRSSPATEPKPEKARKAKQRMPIDDFDSSSDTEEQPEPSPSFHEREPLEKAEASKESLSDSPVQITEQEQAQAQHQQGQHPPALMIDTSSQDDPSTSPVSPLSSAELIEVPHDSNARQETPASTAQSSTTTPTWSDANLRSYLEDDSEIRDLLVVVHDKPDVKPTPNDHPRVKDLFKEENRKLGEISNRLDGLLGDWLARKSK